ncbi:HU family DNA-binding protein [Parabacteroides gordonii]|uniref:HU domain-containing protein n=1 Tax=Parabacteroides gordonii MS-1 = DSM 23371 TaxID=1203610 RepID=A0A0F5JB60_9BACT|nr:DsbA family protein [Parabacteroides gordonii]KKB55101.1 hypothetical protein HMPREF1536_02555 [Parabacteroides gordonii MS-1 = DSM 23371]MCA5582094.1 DsbA family protein [Parabacteroides gordonii]
MALKYVVKKTVFGFDQTKTPKYVARPLPAGTVGYPALCDQVAKVGALASRSMVILVLESLFEVLEENLTNHLSVKLGNFGTLRPSFSSKCQNEENEVNADVLCHRKIIFTPGADFKRVLSNVSVRKSEQR